MQHSKSLEKLVSEIEQLKEELQQLRADNRLMNLATENMLDMVNLVDINGNLKYVSPSATNFIGHSIMGEGASFLKYIYPQDEERVRTEFFDALNACRSSQIEFRICQDSGNIIWVEAICKPILDEHGLVEGAVISARDIMERKNLEEEKKLQEDRTRLLATNVQDIIGRISLYPEPHYEYLSPSAFDYTGHRADEFLHDNTLLFKLVHPEDLETAKNFYQGKFIGKCVLRVANQEGSYTHFEVRSTPIYDDNQQLIAIEGLGRDITEQVKLIEELRLKAELLDAAQDSIYLVNSMGKFVYVNEAACTSLGYTKSELLAMGPKDTDTSENANQVEGRMKILLERGCLTFESANVKKDKSIIPVEVSVRVVTSQGNQYFLSIARNITERKRYEEKLRYTSHVEPVTELYNRRYFEQEMLRVEKTAQPVGLFIIDLNGLKLINDTFGHRAGDDALKALASILKSSVRQDDTVARIGGDEFAILFKDVDKVKEYLEKIQNLVEIHGQQNSAQYLSVSIGYAIRISPDIPMEAVFKEADNNMYRAKLHKSRSRENSLIKTLMKALEARDFITEGHGERLGQLLKSVGEYLKLPESDIFDLRLLAQFHDIGKVGIPDNILFKPGTLTSDERFEMQRHSEIGYRIAKTSSELMPISDCILKHHERWDGNGYPLGLRGKEIPMPCRMLAIVDAYDAMTNDRPYREALSHEAAIKELYRCSGTQFDPELVPIVIKMLESMMPHS